MAPQPGLTQTDSKVAAEHSPSIKPPSIISATISKPQSGRTDTIIPPAKGKVDPSATSADSMENTGVEPISSNTSGMDLIDAVIKQAQIEKQADKSKRSSSGEVTGEDPDIDTTSEETLPPDSPLRELGPSYPIPNPLPDDTSEQAPTDGGDSYAKAARTGSLMQDMHFNMIHDGKTPALVLIFSEPVEFTLMPMHEDSVSVLIPNAKLSGKHLSLPFFPQDSVRGFQSVLAREIPNGLQLDIFLSESLSVDPYRNANEIWITLPHGNRQSGPISPDAHAIDD